MQKKEKAEEKKEKDQRKKQMRDFAVQRIRDQIEKEKQKNLKLE